MDDVAISVRSVSKSFKVPHEKRDTLKSKALNVFSGDRKSTRLNSSH